MQELYQERPDSSSTKDENKTGDPSRLAIDEAEELSQVIQNPFTVRRRMTSGVKRVGRQKRGGLLAAARSKRGVPRVVMDVSLILEPVPHGIDVKPDFTRAEEPEGLSAIGRDDEFRCSAKRNIETRVAHVKRERLTARRPTWWLGR